MDIKSLIQPYGGEVTADALLVVKEETHHLSAELPDSPRAKRLKVAGQETTDDAASFSMPAHRALLWPLSEYFASKFESWSCNDSKPQITLLVPAGQLEVGKALVKAIYNRIPANLTQQQLLQLLVLAESYRINKISTAVANVISSIPRNKLEWETVLAMEQLPAAEPLYLPLIAAAQARRMQLLGDLDMVWALEGEQQRQLLQKQLRPGAVAAEARAKTRMSSTHFNKCGRYFTRSSMLSDRSQQCLPRSHQCLASAVIALEEAAAAAAHSSVLPHTLLLQLTYTELIQLLQSRELKAESENTVHYTITRWLEQHPEVTSTEQLKRLASLVRLNLCTPNYVTMCVYAKDSWLLPLLSPREAVHQAVASANMVSSRLLHYDYKCISKQGSRLASVLDKLELAWNPPLSDIHQVLERLLRDFMSPSELSQPHAYKWQGFEFKMIVGAVVGEQEYQIEPDEEEQEVRPLVHALYVDISVNDDAAAFAHSITAWRAPDSRNLPRQPYLQREMPLVSRSTSTRAFLLVDRFWAEGENCEPHTIVETIGYTWEEVEGHLRRRKLVFNDNCLHLTAEVSKVA